METGVASDFSRRDEPREPAPWSWADALAAARPGLRYRTLRILFSMVRHRFSELGWGEGDEFVCVENTSEGVVLRRPDGSRLRLEREYAWFVQVEPLETRAGA